jgi:nucleoside diphosphate kinase
VTLPIDQNRPYRSSQVRQIHAGPIGRMRLEDSRHTEIMKSMLGRLDAAGEQRSVLLSRCFRR